jgi:DNA repair protein RadD
MIYRDYQQKMHDEFQDAWAGGARAVLGVAPTGSGKGALVAGNVDAFDGPSCAIAHRQELVGQLSMSLCRYGVEHRIVAAEATVREIVRQQLDEFGRSFYRPGSIHGVASVDTLVLLPENDRWLPNVGLAIVDECFPAGTLIGEVPIEDVRPGDEVDSFDPTTGEMQKRQVVRTFKSPMPDDMVRLVFGGHHVVRCTRGHPILTKRGWVAAANLLRSDEVATHGIQLYPVLESLHPSAVAGVACSQKRQGLLQQVMRDRLPSRDLLQGNGRNEPKVCICPDDGAKPDAGPNSAKEGVRNTQADRARAESARREWAASDCGGTCSGGKAEPDGLLRTGGDRDRETAGLRLSACLQSGLGVSHAEAGDRSGRKFAQRVRAPGAGCEERRTPTFTRLDSVEVYQPTDTDGNRGNDAGDFVYNFEVAGTHTYVANGLVVHNCHHVAREGTIKGSVGKWMKALNRMPRAKVLGLTATPSRADGKGLGRHADGVFDVMVEGPPMRELINRGYLSEYQVFCPKSDIDLSQVAHAPSGDFSPDGVRKAVHASRTIVGDMVGSYLQFAPGQRGISFCVDIEAASEVCAEYRRRGVPAEILTGKTPTNLRAQILRRLRDGSVLQVVAVEVLNEGTDVPAVECISFARPTDSLGLYMQQGGRGLRIAPGKKIATIIDHVGNFLRHKPFDMPRKWSLDRREKRGKGAALIDGPPMRACPQCTRPYERVLVGCPYCGHSPEPALRSGPEHVDGDLVLLTPEVLAKMRGEIDAPLRVPYGATGAIEGALRKHHTARSEAQRALRAAMDQWAGYRVLAGDNERVQQRRFFHQFGVDVLTAQALPAREADALRQQIEGAYHA